MRTNPGRFTFLAKKSRYVERAHLIDSPKVLKTEYPGF